MFVCNSALPLCGTSLTRLDSTVFLEWTRWERPYLNTLKLSWHHFWGAVLMIRCDVKPERIINRNVLSWISDTGIKCMSSLGLHCYKILTLSILSLCLSPSLHQHLSLCCAKKQQNWESGTLSPVSSIVVALSITAGSRSLTMTGLVPKSRVGATRERAL